MHKDIDALILAGGKSSRMGRDKALLPFKDGLPLLEYQCKKLDALFERLYIGVKEPIALDCEANILLDPSQRYSVLSAITYALRVSQKPLFVLAVDMPLVDKVLIEALIKEFKQNHIPVYAKDEAYIHPLCAIYTPELIAPFEETINKGQEKLTLLMKTLGFRGVESDQKRLQNINYPHEYEALLR